MDAAKPMMKICDVKNKCVAIVRFGPSGFSTDGCRPGEYYQVTIDPARVSPSGEFIRFGIHGGTQDVREGLGDELCGWQRCEALCVVEILGEWTGDEPPIMHYGSGFTTQLAE
jgi:hypothetical protein